MKYKSRAIALSYIKHGESAIISKVLTEEKGLQSFIVKGVRSNKSKKSLGLLQPLELSLINATYLPKRKLQYLTEIQLYQYKKTEGINMTKNLLSLFIAEVISKVLYENKIDRALFLFVWELKISLTNHEKIDANFPLIFLLELSNYLGFYPLYERKKGGYFNLEVGEFTNTNQNTKHSINKENSCYLKALLKKQEINIPYVNRNQLLLNLICYYKLQHHELKNMTSHLIIESLRS